MADDDLTAELARIAGRGYRNGATGAECARLSDAAAVDIPRAVAALRAVLELAGNANPILSGFSDMSVIGFTLDPKAIREAISREITGKGESDA